MKKILKKFPAIVFALSFSTGAFAISLQDLLNGASITADGNIYDQWTLNNRAASTPTLLPDLSLIDVTALTGVSGFSQGLEIDAGLELSADGDGIGAFIELGFGFRVSTTSSAASVDVSSLSMGQASVTLDGDNGNIVTTALGTAPGLSDIAAMDIEFSFLDGAGLTEVLSNSAMFAPAQTLLVHNDIRVYAAGIGETASLFTLNQVFSQVPVPIPGALYLFVTALAPLFWKSSARVRRISIRR